mgnify:CR=1 FL=1
MRIIRLSLVAAACGGGGGSSTELNGKTFDGMTYKSTYEPGAATISLRGLGGGAGGGLLQAASASVAKISPFTSQFTRSRECSSGKCGAHSDDVAVAQ